MKLSFAPIAGDPQKRTTLDFLSDGQIRELAGYIGEKTRDWPLDPKFEYVATICADTRGGVKIVIQRMMSEKSVNGGL
jgi:hypothetical protein